MGVTENFLLLYLSALYRFNQLSPGCGQVTLMSCDGELKMVGPQCSAKCQCRVLHTYFDPNLFLPHPCWCSCMEKDQSGSSGRCSRLGSFRGEIRFESSNSVPLLESSPVSSPEWHRIVFQCDLFRYVFTCSHSGNLLYALGACKMAWQSSVTRNNKGDKDDRTANIMGRHLLMQRKELKIQADQCQQFM